MSHGPSEIILICRFDNQETFIKFENSFLWEAQFIFTIPLLNMRQHLFESRSIECISTNSIKYLLNSVKLLPDFVG